MNDKKDPENVEELTKDEYLAGLATITEKVDDWRDHLPYEAFRYFNRRDDIRAQYGSHVESCKYCQELIKVFGLPSQ